MQLIDGRPVYAATDLVGFLACEHRLALERAALAGLVEKPIRNDPSIELIAKRGEEHERRYLADLEASGRTIVRIDKDGSAVDGLRADAGQALREAAAATRAALEAGVDVVYQATFFDGTWRGHADFLLRVAGASALGEWHYEVADTKLARHVTGGAVVQICSYMEQLTAVQGRQPERFHVVLGGSTRETVTLRVADAMAYFRRVKAQFEEAVDDSRAGPPAYPPPATYPEPVEHCEVCRWNPACRVRRRADDDLSLVAGISGRLRRGLKERGTPTRAGLAGLALPLRPKLERSSDAALARAREQARIQVESDGLPTPRWELLDPEWTDDLSTGDRALTPDRGFLVLPQPSPNDLFFDIEGDPFALDDGVDYLFGVLEPAAPDPDGRLLADGSPAPRFHEIWSRNAAGDVTRAAEKLAFEALVDLLVGRLDADPALHVYHYAAYERTALARLAQRHATREHEVDRLLRGGVLVDLYRVVRQGIRAGVESYSIKRLEPLYGLRREVELRSASSSIVDFEAWLEGGASEEGAVGEAILAEIAGYNRDDVLSNWRLRDWLEARRQDLGRRLGGDVPRPPASPEAAAARPLTERQARVAALVQRLTAGLADRELSDLTAPEHATWLLAQLLEWHRREDKAFWWRYYDLRSMTDEDLVDEREPIGQVTLLEELGEAGRGGRLQRFGFPVQDHAIKAGRRVDDPRTGRSAGTVEAIDEAGLTIVLRRTKGDLARGVPSSLIPGDHVSTDAQEEALIELGTWVADHGIDGPGRFGAARQLLLRRPPRIAGRMPWAPLRLPDEAALDAASRLALALDESTLAIQGPPGTGKTWTGARMIVALAAAGWKVGVTANSHKVIGHVLDEVAKAIAEQAAARPGGGRIRIGQKTGLDGEPTSDHASAYKENAEVVAALASDEVDIVGGTAWLWARADLRDRVDVLVVDEAGQVSLANTVAVSAAARSLVLLGDPQQLDQPTQGSHPPGAERSALAHLLGERATIAADAGLFLERTWRLHPDVCAFTSEVFYEGKLAPEAGRERQSLAGAGVMDGTGIRFVQVRHAGNDIDSPEEAATIAALLGALFERSGGATWTDARGVVRPLHEDDVLIVAPYNAHVERIAATLRRSGLGGVRVGTVDKFQGQEAPLSIYAMGSSSPEDAPRGMEFLYSLNRLNVATSRARCLAVVVASPELVRVACRTPRQIRLANALCRLVEMAGPG